MASATKLYQQGFKAVAVFNHKDRAEARAEFHRKQGFDARVTAQTNSKGVVSFVVYVKKEA